MLAIAGEPLFVADWLRVLMIHLEVDPDPLQKAVSFPLDLWHDRAFVTLVAFTLRDLRPRLGGSLTSCLLRPIATHDFLNVRTYVTVNEEPGIHFLAEWLPNRLAVKLGPRTFALPYRHGHTAFEHDCTKSRMRGRVDDARTGHTLAYHADLPANATFSPCATGTLTEWLMERYSAFNCYSGRKQLFRVWHPPWLQCTVTATLEQDSLLTENWPWMRTALRVGANFSTGLCGVWMGRPRRMQVS